MKEMLNTAYQNKYGVLAINCFNLETMRATVNAAIENKAPIIINIAEEHLKSNITPEMAGVIVKELSAETTIPIALNLDHGKNKDLIKRCIRSGFTSLMIDASEKTLQENIGVTKEIVALAKKNQISIEAELGHMGNAPTYEIATIKKLMTRIEDVKQFVKETEIDCLAVSIGTAHGLYSSDTVPQLDFELLSAINEEANIPLALHGGSGAGEKNIRESITNGIAKINVGAAIFNAGREGFNRNESDLSKLMLSMEKSYKNEIKKYMIWSKSINKIK